MGEVYRARDTRLGRVVAVKVLPAPFASDPTLRQRLQAEARAISQLSHPHICTLYDIGEQSGTAFLVMELIDGETLADRMARHPGRGLAVDESAESWRAGGRGTRARHIAAGIVHRDLKPANVMLARRGSSVSGPAQVKLLDFGLAKVMQPVESAMTSSLPTAPPLPLTAAGTILGTFRSHVAPSRSRAPRRTHVPTSSRSDACSTRCLRVRGRSMARVTRASWRPSWSAHRLRWTAARPAFRRCSSASSIAVWRRTRMSAGRAPPICQRLASGAPPATGPARQRYPSTRPRTQWTRQPSRPVSARLQAGAGALAWRTLCAHRRARLETRFEIPPPVETMWSPSPVASTVQVALSPDGRRWLRRLGKAGPAAALDPSARLDAGPAVVRH